MTGLSNYPTQLDSLANLPDTIVDGNVTQFVHAAYHNTIDDAIISIETELGVLPKGSYASVVARLNDGIVKTPGASGQILRPSADGVGIINRPFSDAQTHNQTEWQNAGGVSTLAYMDRVGNFSAASLAISGTPLASTHLSDTTNLARIGSANSFTQTQTISAASGLILSGNGGATTLALSNATQGVGFTIGGDVSFTRSAAGIGEFAQATTFKRAVGSSTAIGVFEVGDVNHRTYISADGVYHWSNGSAVTDLNLYRIVAGQLQTDYQFNAALDIYSRVGGAGEVKIGAFGPANQAAISVGHSGAWTLYLSNANEATTTGDLIAGNINVSGSYKVAGQQITSAALADTSSLARLASPSFTGTPNAPIADIDTVNINQIATAGFVFNQGSALLPAMNGVATIGLSTRFARADHIHPFDTTRAPILSPTFTGIPAAPTAALGNSTTQLATTAFVATALTNANLSNYALLASPTFTGVPKAPTAASNDNSTQLATTAFVATAITNINLSAYATVASLSAYSTTSTIAATYATISSLSSYATTASLSSYALLSSPNFSGTPTVPTASSGTANGQIASTSFVSTAISNLNLGATYATISSLSSYSTTATIAATYATIANLALKAPLASPALTGTPTAPTPTASDNSTKIATTAFVVGRSNATATGGALSSFTVSSDSFPSGGTGMLGLGLSFTPNVSGKFVVHIVGDTGVITNVACTGEIRFGTGGAPSNGPGSAGSLAGGAFTMRPNENLSWVGYINGVSGTTYWVDVAIVMTGNPQGGNTIGVKGGSYAIHEVA